ncbi:hypothetical protein [Motilibacter aurantiacus]|uniref:hypothetical protein n=1 Tax=Motilibacter aurantiacus TaxID=2714955 RepID=UPI001407EE1E|nr:hypothetical protein [Motilibacter aurantiacus]NHC47156.1 hypothetical protein [Motilibacter aurantiacus]
MTADLVSPAVAPGDGYAFVTLSPAVPLTTGPTPETSADVLLVLCLVVLAVCALLSGCWLVFARRNRCGF